MDKEEFKHHLDLKESGNAMRWDRGRAQGLPPKRKTQFHEELGKRQPPDILKMCPIPSVTTPTRSLGRQLLGLISAQALFRPLGPDFNSSASGSGAP